MHTKRTDSLLPETRESTNKNGQYKASEANQADTQVKPVKQKVYRRKFNKSDKLKILEAFDACNTPYERGAFLRKEGLYYASISKWRLELSNRKSNHGNIKTHQMTLAHNQVMRENAALKRKLAQAEAIIELQKKVSELLSEHVLTPETSEVSS